MDGMKYRVPMSAKRTEYFPTLLEAVRFCGTHFNNTGVVLAIEPVEPDRVKTDFNQERQP